MIEGLSAELKRVRHVCEIEKCHSWWKSSEAADSALQPCGGLVNLENESAALDRPHRGSFMHDGQEVPADLSLFSSFLLQLKWKSVSSAEPLVHFGETPSRILDPDVFWVVPVPELVHYKIWPANAGVLLSFWGQLLFCVFVETLFNRTMTCIHHFLIKSVFLVLNVQLCVSWKWILCNQVWARSGGGGSGGGGSHGQRSGCCHMVWRRRRRRLSRGGRCRSRGSSLQTRNRSVQTEPSSWRFLPSTWRWARGFCCASRALSVFTSAWRKVWSWGKCAVMTCLETYWVFRKV